MRTALASRFLLAHAVTWGASIQSGCGRDGPSEPTGRVAIDVATLSLPGVVEATYSVRVTNGLGAEVWQRTLTSTAFGDGVGSLSYVGPCDASPGVADNTIALTLVALRDADGPLTAADFTNPAPTGDPITLVRTCAPSADVSARFDLTIARSAGQGFFDVAVAFDDIFCSAKLDCESAPGVPLELLHRGTERDLTAVLGFACTAGPGTDTHLWMDRVTVTCEGGGPFVVDVAAGPGNLDPVFDEPSADLFYQAATYRGSEALQGWNKAYWNVALGLNEAAFAELGACRLTTTASASDGPLVDGVTPAETRWPLVTWDVALTDGGGARVCTTHGLDGDDGVSTRYSATSGHGFYAGMRRATGLVTVTGATPDATSSLTCTRSSVAVGEQTTCTLIPRQAGGVIATAAGNFQLAAPSGTLSALTPAYGTSFTFTFTATTSAATPIDSGVGVSWPLTTTATPDATSTLTCDATSVPVGATTRCTITPKRAETTIYALPSAFSVSASAGTTSALAADASTFTFMFTAPATSGPVMLDDGVNTLPILVTATPDASALTCADMVLDVGATTRCTITPLESGAPIYTLASAFAVTATAGSTSALTAAGSTFTFTLTAPATSGPLTLEDAFSTFDITVVATPDATSTLACADDHVRVDAQTSCTITPMQGGVPITARASAFAAGTDVGAVSAIGPAVGASLTFTYTAPPLSSRVATIEDGFSVTEVTVYELPDMTSTLSCGAATLPASAQRTCVISPKKADVAIVALASAFTPATTGGAVSAIAEVSGASLTFTLTAPATTGPITVGDGLHTHGLVITDTPDATSTLTCAAAVLDVGQATTCTLTPRKSGAPIHTLASAFAPSATDGSVSALTPDVGTSFTFTFMAPAASAAVSVDEGPRTFPIIVVDAPDLTSTLDCVAAELLVDTTTQCSITPMKAGVAIFTRATAFTASTTGGLVGEISPAVGNTLSFVATAPLTTGSITLGDGLHTDTVVVYDEPDATSTLACPATTVLSGAQLTCDITPKKSGAVITARASSFTPSATIGSAAVATPSLGTAFTFTFTAPATTGPGTIGDGFHTAPVTVIATPDTTSTITCEPSSIPGAATSTCTITPKRASVTVWSLAAAFTPSASAGAVSAHSPSLGTSFTFTFTAPLAAQSVSVGSGLGATTVTITTSCADGYRNGAESGLDCGGACGACPVGQGCSVAADCQTGYCDGGGLCADGCPADPLKTVPGLCGCGVSDTASQRLGGTAADPARSCTDVQDEGQACGDRTYWIDPNGGSVGDAFEVYCDMTSDGGAWMKLESAHFPHWFTAGTYLAHNRATPGSANYSIVGDRASFVDVDGCYELRVEVGDTGTWTDAPLTRTVWKQCHDPFTQTTDGSDYTFLGGEAPITCGGFNGLHHKYQGNSYTSDPDANDSINCWWMQIVPHTRYQEFPGYLDGYGSTSSHLWQSLWVRAAGLGKGREHPATSCHALFGAGVVEDGLYWIDPNGGDSGDAFTTWCDMTLDTGWTRLEAARYPFFFDSGNWDMYQPTLPTAASFSLLRLRAGFASGGCTTWRFTVGSSGDWRSAPSEEIAWRQCHDPFTQSTDGAGYTYVSGTPSGSCGGFVGLHHWVQSFMFTTDAATNDLAGCWGMQTVPHTQYPGHGGYYDGWGGDSAHQWQALWVK